LNGVTELTVLVWNFFPFCFSVPQIIFQACLINDSILSFRSKFLHLALDFGHQKLFILSYFLFELNINSIFLFLRKRLISQKADWSFLQNDFPLEGIFHVEKRIVFIEIFLLFECFIIEVEVGVFFVFEMFLFFSKIFVDVLVILSFFKEFSFFA
jgi:hypothetical protein